jgi:hypothetical protein
MTNLEANLEYKYPYDHNIFFKRNPRVLFKPSQMRETIYSKTSFTYLRIKDNL